MSLGLYTGKHIASAEMMTLEIVSELISNQKMRVLFAGIDKKYQHLVDSKVDELDELENNLYMTEFPEVRRIEKSLKQEIDDFLESVR